MITTDKARKNEAAILKALASLGQVHLAKLMGVDETLISKQKSSGQLAKTAEMLAHLGLKVVPVSMKCFDPEYVEHLRALAQIGLKQPSSGQELSWEE